MTVREEVKAVLGLSDEELDALVQEEVLPSPDDEDVDLSDVCDAYYTYKLSTADLYFDVDGAILITVDSGCIQVSDPSVRTAEKIHEHGAIVWTDGDGYFHLIPVWEDERVIGWFLRLRTPTEEPQVLDLDDIKRMPL